MKDGRWEPRQQFLWSWKKNQNRRFKMANRTRSSYQLILFWQQELQKCSSQPMKIFASSTLQKCQIDVEDLDHCHWLGRWKIQSLSWLHFWKESINGAEVHVWPGSRGPLIMLKRFLRLYRKVCDEDAVTLCGILQRERDVIIIAVTKVFFFLCFQFHLDILWANVGKCKLGFMTYSKRWQELPRKGGNVIGFAFSPT